MAQQANSLSHAKWLCKYHVVFAPKYRRKIIYNQYRESMGETLRRLCPCKGAGTVEGHLMPDHARMLAGIPPKTGVSSFMGYLKGKSSLVMSGKHGNLKYKFGNRKFWCEGRCASAVGPDEATIAKRIRGQEAHDRAPGKLGAEERGDPFARRQGRPWPERGEGQRLEALPVPPLGYTQRANHPLCGWS